MSSKKRKFDEPVVNDSSRVNADGDQNEKFKARNPYAGITIRDSAGRRINPSEFNQCLVIDRRKRHLRAPRSSLLSDRRKMSSDQDNAFQESPQLMARSLPTLSAPKREEPPDPVNPDEYDWTTGLEMSEAMADREAAQKTKKNARASPPWYKRDYEAEEAEIMGDTELSLLLDDFYGKTAEKLDGEASGGSSGSIERNQPELPDVLGYDHAIPLENSISYLGRAVCVSLDPRVYLKHPWGCGCNQGSRSAPAEITRVPNRSTTEARAHPWGSSKYFHGCESPDESPAAIPPFKTEMAGRTSSATVETSFGFEDTKRNGNFLPAARSVYPERGRNPAPQKLKASFRTNLQYQSRLLSEPDNTFNINDWVHDQL